MITSSLLAEVRPLAERFAAAGFRLYLVGGIVRDQLLGRALSPTTDIDFTTDAAPESIKRVVGPLADAVWTQGERFGTIGCRIGARDYEITTHRGESYEPHSRKPEVVFSSELLHDLERRDFTVNAMAVEVPEVRLFDPFGGEADLRERVLRTPLRPEVSFSDDPLRMLRAARFISGYTLVPEPALIAAIPDLSSRMSIVSVERRRDELDKLLAVADPSDGFRFLRQQSLIQYVVPSLDSLDDLEFDRAVDAVRQSPRVRELRLASLFVVGPHQRSDVERQVRALRYANDVVAAVGAVVQGVAMITAHQSEWRAVDVRRLAAATGAHLDAAVAVAATCFDVDQIRQEIDRLRAIEDLDEMALALDGDAVMELLGLEPGSAVGRAMRYLRELRITDGPLSPEEAARRLERWWRSGAVGQ